jgi:hypothetical protein
MHQYNPSSLDMHDFHEQTDPLHPFAPRQLCALSIASCTCSFLLSIGRLPRAPLTSHLATQYDSQYDSPDPPEIP